MKNTIRCLALGVAISILAACVSTRQIRTDFPPTADGSQTATMPPPAGLSPVCDTGAPREGENRRVIEDYGQYVLGFAEFDDQGWSYDHDKQLQALQARLHADLRDPNYKDMDFVIMVFVHGWHHNAHDNDCNVQEARQMVSLASQQFDTAVEHDTVLHRKRRVFGIYVGWRGESVDAAGLRYTTVIDRRDVAEKVAKGSIRQLFANLHEEERAAIAAASDRTPADQKVPSPSQQARMYTNIVGHSFGGLIVFNSLSQQLINNLTAAREAACNHADNVATMDSWPDKVILINPAFEATRFEPLNRLADEAAECNYQPRHPTLMVITADDDRWTGAVFTAGRSVATVFEDYDDSTATSRSVERNANLRAIGFVNRYRTHRLCLQPNNPQEPVTAAQALTSVSTANPDKLAYRAVWVIGAPPDIVYGHNGFLYARRRHGKPEPYLLQWVAETHVAADQGISPPNTCGGWH